jgi:hypothetical protein
MKMGITPRVAQMDGLPEHGDIRDWLKTYTSNDLARLIEEAKPAPDDPQHRSLTPHKNRRKNRGIHGFAAAGGKLLAANTMPSSG